ncbi:MAG: cytochrome P450 [Burkholderiaceae bacterium]|nr:MAG: cytochrome P450 [Burkholderiaceae bacterium]
METSTDATPKISPPVSPPSRRLGDLPGPVGVPVLGNLLQIRPASMHRQLETWAQTYGRLFRIRMGRRELLVVADHELFGAVLRDRPERFRRPLMGGRISREMGFDQGLFFANDDVWRRQRRMVMAGLDPGHIKAYFPSLLKVARRLQTRWQAVARSGASIDLQADLMCFTVDAIAGLAFGADVNTLASDEDVIQQHLNKIFPAMSRRIFSLVPYWRYIRLPVDRALDRSVAEVRVAVRGFIAQARRRLQADPALREHPSNLLEAMIIAADQGDSGMTDHDVAGNVVTMLLAGEDTTANTLAWMIYLLHRSPATLQRAREEVRRVAGDPSQFTPERIAGLDYLEACAHETMRLKPVAPLLAVQAVKGTTIADVQIPADTVVIGLMRHDSLLERHFPDAAAFKPERWLGDGGPAQAASSAKRVSMPFGAGPRVCPGRYLALLEIKMAAATLLSGFEIESVGPATGTDVPEHMAFSMGPLGLRMRLREHDRA